MWHIGIYSAWCFLLFFFLKVLPIIFANILSLFSLSCIPIHICYIFEIAPIFLNILLCFNCFFYFHFSSRSFYWHIFKVINSFNEHVESVEEPIESISGREFLISKICFPFSLIVSILLLVLFICFCMLSTFFIRVLNILIILILNSLPSRSNICDICNSSSSDCFSLHPMFFVFFFCHDMQFFVERWTFCLG